MPLTRRRRSATTPSGSEARSLARAGPYVLTVFSSSDQPPREMAAEALGVLDCPPALRELVGPAEQLSIAGDACVDSQRRHRRVRRRVHRSRDVAGLVRIDPDDHDEGPLGLVMWKSTVGMPTSRPAATGITPLLSQTGAGRRPGGTPWVSQPGGGRRFTSQPGRRPTGSYDHEAVSTGPRECASRRQHRRSGQSRP